MRYDLDLIGTLCDEIGLSTRMKTDQRIEIDLGEDAILCFQNAAREEDCLIGFLVCEREVERTVIDRWLIHSEYNDEFKYVQPGERVIVRRAEFSPIRENP